MQSASWIARQKTPQLGLYGQVLCCHFMQTCLSGLQVYVNFFVLFCFKLQCKKHQALATVRHYFMQKPWWILKMLCFDWKEENSGLSCQTGPNWGIVLDFNLSPVYSACAKHNTAPGFFQRRPGKQLWMKSGRGSGALPFDKHSSMK